STFPINSGYIVTQDGCTQLNSSVVNYLTANGTTTATVSDLLNLANDVLGGTKTAGAGGVPSLSAINAAIDAINNIFDGCKNFIGYYSTCPYSTMLTTSVRGEEPLGTLNALKVSTYPNPFRDKVRFVIESPVSGRVSLEVYNMLGQKVHTVFQGHVTGGISQVVEYNVSLLRQGNLMYTLIMNGERVTGKLLYLKQ
ncbi:MAG: T9SS type A sorting domain-containing protein, partial [Bacteroidota bacterium]|nr:T9SS type A sorting domain-containing protein [Bacteroidota bacterium]